MPCDFQLLRWGGPKASCQILENDGRYSDGDGKKKNYYRAIDWIQRVMMVDGIRIVGRGLGGWMLGY